MSEETHAFPLQPSQMKAIPTPHPQVLQGLCAWCLTITHPTPARAPASWKHLSYGTISLTMSAPSLWHPGYSSHPLSSWLKLSLSILPMPSFSGPEAQRAEGACPSCTNTRLPFVLCLSIVWLRGEALGSLVWLFAWHLVDFFWEQASLF